MKAKNEGSESISKKFTCFFSIPNFMIMAAFLRQALCKTYDDPTTSPHPIGKIRAKAHDTDCRTAHHLGSRIDMSTGLGTLKNPYLQEKLL